MVLLAGDKGIALLPALGKGKAGLSYTVLINGKREIVASKLNAMSREQLDAAGHAAIH
ncbi:MAG: hypothetical protein IPI44_24670 [Sulfuritalea sp.]|nr:hypothetical protein [Sulfuritalea sp.]MBK8119052.1 hypothetical protein [Sulfuritalea sp.]